MFHCQLIEQGIWLATGTRENVTSACTTRNGWHSALLPDLHPVAPLRRTCGRTAACRFSNTATRVVADQ